MSEQCKAIQGNGKQCTKKAKLDGYCGIHCKKYCVNCGDEIEGIKYTTALKKTYCPKIECWKKKVETLNPNKTPEELFKSLKTRQGTIDSDEIIYYINCFKCDEEISRSTYEKYEGNCESCFHREQRKINARLAIREGDNSDNIKLPIIVFGFDVIIIGIIVLLLGYSIAKPFIEGTQCDKNYTVWEYQPQYEGSVIDSDTIKLSRKKDSWRNLSSSSQYNRGEDYQKCKESLITWESFPLFKLLFFIPFLISFIFVYDNARVRKYNRKNKRE